MDAQELKTLGNEAFSQQQYKKAAKIYRDAITLDPTNAVLYSNRAICFIKLQDWERAIRDTDSGLKFSTEDKTTVKLLYRKGLALLGLGNAIDAAGFFEKVLEKDPNNKAAQTELEKCESLLQRQPDDTMDVDVNTHEPKIKEIPIKTVEKLPSEYEALLHSKPASETPEPMATKQETVSSAVSEEIENLFGKKTKASEPPKPVSFNERSGSIPLTALKSIDLAKKVKAYKYVIELAPSVVQDTFSIGLDPEFVAFFIEAAAHVSTTRDINNWEDLVLAKLKTMSKLKRFEISLGFASPAHIKTLLGNVSKTEEFKELLHS